MEMTGAEVICRILKDQSVKYVFGVPGNTEIPLLDTLAQTPEITYLSAIHEAVSMGMADGYARASDEVGVVLVHTAPGTAYIVGNLYNAYNAGTPIVVLAGQQDSRLQWHDPYLDSDLLPLVSEYTKERWWVGHAQDIETAVRRAFKEAATPPKGPVFVAIPRDLQSQTVAADFRAHGGQVPVDIRPDSECLTRAAQLLVDAEQPAILAGHQVPDAGAVGELVELAETLGAPVYTTAQVPKLIFPASHPLYYSRVPPIGFSLPGLEGHADVLLAVGSQLFKQLFYVEGPIIPPEIRLIHMDVDPRSMGRDCVAEMALVTNPKVGLAELTAEVRRLMSPAQHKRSQQRFEQLRNARAEAKEAHELTFKKEWDAVPLRPSRAIREIADVILPRGGVVVDEAVMLTTYVEYIMEFSEPASYFSSNACLGWGLPASLGVALAAPGKPVVALVGDGSALFGIQALWTAAKYHIPVIAVVLNNRGYAAIKWAFSMYPEKGSPQGADLGYDLGNVDFLKLAQAFGIAGHHVEDAAQIRPALEAAIEEGKPALIDIAVDPRDVGYGLPGLP